MKSKNKKNKFNIKDKKGIALMDVVMAAIIIAVFTGTISGIMYKSYIMAIDIQETSAANAYATIIMEKVDEKPFEDIVDIGFVDDLITNKELEGDISTNGSSTGRFKIDFRVEADNIDPVNLKDVTVTVSYGKNTGKKITLSKLKVKEVNNNE